MTAIISRSQESATQATPAARERNAKKPAIGASPVAPAPSAPQPEAGRASAEPWRAVIRQFLTETHDVLFAAALPSDGIIPQGLPSELAVHCVGVLHALLDAPDTSVQWEDGFETYAQLQWARDSMRAAVALLGTEHDELHSVAEAYRVVCQRLVSACEALEQATDITAMSSALQVAAAKPFQEKPRPPIRREPEAEALDAAMAEAISDQAVRTTLLVDWCLKARGVLDHIASAAQGDSAFRNTLIQHEIAFSNANWRECRMGECLEDVLHLQSNLIRQIAGSAA